MTTQFSQRVTFELVLLWAPNNSYFILSPQAVSINNHCLSFVSFNPFSEIDSILPHYSPAFPVDFGQFGQAWCEETIRAYFNHLDISPYINQIQFERVRYQPNGNNSSVSGLAYCVLSCSLLLNNQIDTDFDNLFANLISSLNTLLTPISQISLSLLGINNIFPTLVHNLEALNENNVPVSIAQILKDKQIDVDMSGTQVSLDDTNLVTQLQNIYTILSSQNATQSAIGSAIQNKDNQSDIVNELRYIFTQNQSEYTYRNINGRSNLSVFKSLYSSSNLNNITNLSRTSIYSVLNRISNKLSLDNDSYNNNDSANLGSKILYNLNNNLISVSDKLQNIETKLEQNLPFATLAQVDVVTDYTQVVKGVGKNE